MKLLKDIRQDFDSSAKELCSSVKYFKRQNIDWDVYLPTKGMNLQRPMVWSLEQKRELIMSILIGRHIPHCAVISIIDKDNPHEEVFQIIDGKQRLSTVFDFLDDKFAIELEGVEYKFSGLPSDYQLALNGSWFRYYIVYESHGSPISDEFKIKWFNFINFAGTPQDKEHMMRLNEKL